MAEPKTRPTRASVAAFLQTLPSPERRRDARKVSAMMRAATGARAVLWGPNIIGFGRQVIVTADGRGTEWPVAAFAPRGTGLVLYFAKDFLLRHPLRAGLGRHRIGRSCLYLRRLAEVDIERLGRLVQASVRASRGAGSGPAARRKQPTGRVRRSTADD